MYITNLPDEVVIPDMLVQHVEDGVLNEEAKRDASAWVKQKATDEHGMRDFWRRQLKRNVAACERYGIPECARFFSYICQLIDEAW